MDAQPAAVGDLTFCPDDRCEAPAEVVDVFDLDSTAGPARHVLILCVRRHRYHVIGAAAD